MNAYTESQIAKQWFKGGRWHILADHDKWQTLDTFARKIVGDDKNGI